MSSAQYDFEEGQRVGIQRSDKGPAKAGSLGKYNRVNTPGNTPNPKKTEAYRSSVETADDDFFGGDLGRSASPYGGKHKAYNNDYNNFGVTGSTMATTSPLTPSRSPRASPRAASVHDLLPSEDNSLMRSGRTPRRKIPEPKPRDEGRWVRHGENMDSRGGCTLKGGLIKAPTGGSQEVIKEPEDPHAQLTKHKEKDAADQTVKFCGFTDRTIRLQDGTAMKAVFTPPAAWNCKTSDCKPGCNCPVCRPMRSSLLPPAGQVVQVDVGNAGTPPYVLQTQVTGMMAVMPEQRRSEDGSELQKPPISGRKSSLATSFGRHFFKKQRLTDYKDYDKTVNEHMVGRGCEPEEKGRDRMQDSSGVEQALTGNLGVSMEGADEIMQRETGQKTRLVAPGVELNTMKGMLVYDDGDMAKQPHLSKKRVEAAWTKTKIFLGHIEPELQQPPPRRVKKPSNNSKVAAFTSDELRKARTFTLRFEGCPTAYLEGGSCMGVGDEDKDKEMRDFRHTKRSPFAFEDHLRGGMSMPDMPPETTTSLSRSASCPPAAMRSASLSGDFAADVDSENVLFQVPTPARRLAAASGAGFAGVPSGYLRETGRGKQFADEGVETKMAKCMAHIAPKDEIIARSDRMLKEPKFAERIYETRFAGEQQKRVFDSILKSIHHLGSASVQDALRWS